MLNAPLDWDDAADCLTFWHMLFLHRRSLPLLTPLEPRFPAHPFPVHSQHRLCAAFAIGTHQSDQRPLRSLLPIPAQIDPALSSLLPP